VTDTQTDRHTQTLHDGIGRATQLSFWFAKAGCGWPSCIISTQIWQERRGLVNQAFCWWEWKTWLEWQGEILTVYRQRYLSDVDQSRAATTYSTKQWTTRSHNSSQPPLDTQTPAYVTGPRHTTPVTHNTTHLLSHPNIFITSIICNNQLS